MRDHTFAPGFRLSTLDVGILIAGGAASLALASIDIWIGLAIAFVVAHFFLFCNVTRMSRQLELIWAAAFAALAIAAAVFGALSWPIALALSAILTVVLTIIEMRRPSYHGVGWPRLNPRLPEWWSGRRP